jgi:hypothetical protein
METNRKMISFFFHFSKKWSTGGMKLTRKTEILGEYLSQCHFIHHKSHTDRPRIEPGPPRWDVGD